MPDTTQSGSGTNIWGAIDSTLSGLYSTGSSALDGYTTLSEKYDSYLANKPQNAPKPEQVTDKTAQLNKAEGPQSARTFGEWVADNRTWLILGFSALLGVALLMRR